MAVHDLTPQLRTRLSRMERAVGWFVVLATVLLVVGFGYYVYKTAERKGWFTPKFRFQTSLNNAAGLKVGDSVKLMGFPAGQIVEITPNEPDAYYGVTVTFTILKPHYGYIWDDSMVKVSSDLLGNRFLEITKGATGVPTILEDTNRTPLAMLRSQSVRDLRKELLVKMSKVNSDLEKTNLAAFDWFAAAALKDNVRANSNLFYTNLTAIYWIPPEETPALNDRLEKLANQIEAALPNILNLTNQIGGALAGVSSLTSNLNLVAIHAQPAVSNLSAATARLDRPGALGEWLIPTNINQQLDATLSTANTNLENLNLAIINLANITSNLNHQVQMNSNMLGGISKTVEDADTLVQGLKHHWLLRSAFKTKRTNAPPEKLTEPVTTPKKGAY